ncbi:hypothetical protein FB45DRAFT_905885 [Roridomyces roridus]|uniref:Uncharacterized protein n=1 Tax=Roridomyces roridus TaxID=1738132 RepID=A0AAD7C5X3_9AGAR|nr:hypothetical protein FB45DRAFT_905885 [Roridomyces roridus]
MKYTGRNANRSPIHTFFVPGILRYFTRNGVSSVYIDSIYFTLGTRTYSLPLVLLLWLLAWFILLLEYTMVLSMCVSACLVCLLVSIERTTAFQ